MKFTGAYYSRLPGLLLISVFLSAGLSAQTSGNWCNEAFRFCVKYPASFLTHAETKINNEGIELRTYDGLSSVSVDVNPSYEILDPRELYNRVLVRITGTQEKPLFVTTVFGDDYYEAFFLSGLESYFLRSYIFRNYHILLTIKTPVNKPEIMTRLREDIDIQLSLK